MASAAPSPAIKRKQPDSHLVHTAAASNPKRTKRGSTSKRKQPSSNPPRHQPTSAPPTVAGSWANLDLILSIKNTDLSLQRKLELAVDFVNSQLPGAHPVAARGPPNPVPFLIEWVQSILKNSDALLDSRCWAILKFCLQKSSVPRSDFILRAVTRMSTEGHDVPADLSAEVHACLSFLLSSSPQAFHNVGVEIWVSCAAEMGKLVHRIFSSQADVDRDRVLLSLAGLLFEHFTSFLKFHASPKKFFPAFVDRLLELLLELLVLLHLRGDGGKCMQARSLLRVVEDVLSIGLFRPDHVSGYFNLRSSRANQEARESKGINESYHDRFFKKLEKIIAEKRAVALGGFGYLFRLFVARAKARKGIAVPSKGIHSGNFEQVQETSKPLFDVFMLFMEPLLLECRRFAGKEFVELGEAMELRLVEAHCTLKSINEMLLSFIQEKIYVRMEDTSDGVHFSFLKEVYETIISLAGKMSMFWTSKLAMDDAGVKKILPSIGREVVVAVGYFLEIEYKVLGEDLLKIWLLMFSYLAAYVSSVAEKPNSLLTSEILNLGCRLIRVYSELRQVDYPIFTMCRAVRLFKTSSDVSTEGLSEFVSTKPLSCQTCLQAVRALVCSPEFRLSISIAIKSIPEGQASGFIQHLKVDVTDSLEWIRVISVESDGDILDETNSPKDGMLYLYLHAEFLGRILSEIYAVLLDSVTVTATNSVLIGNSIKNLMQIIRPNFSNLVQNQSCKVDGFFYSVTGISISNIEMAKTKTALLAMSWVFVFFFRIYISSRNMYRQSISLMPPRSSRKTSIGTGNLFTVLCGLDWIQRPESMEEEYFSWITKPSMSLPDVIKLLLDDFLSNSFAGNASLVYVIHLMALQRLNDLNRLIKAFEFFEEWDAHKLQMQLPDVADKEKANGKLKELITVARKEASELVNFMTGYLQLLSSDGLHVEASETKKKLSEIEDAWDMGVCSLDEASLPTALWGLLCQNTDIWCVHASNKNLKKFLSHLFLHLLPRGSTSSESRNQSMNGPACQRVTMQHISLKFLSDTVPFEQTVPYKHFASRFCRILKKLLSPILSDACSNKIDLSSLPDWSEMLGMFEKGLAVEHGHSSLPPSDFLLSNVHYLKQTDRQSLPSFNAEFKTCENLLSFLCKMCGVFVNHESITLYTTYVINMERLMVSGLLSYNDESSIHNPNDHLSLFMSCRRVMKHIIVASAEGNSNDKPSSFFADVFNSSSVLWLLKSVSEIVGLPHAFFPGQNPRQLKEIIFPLIGYTSSTFFMISKCAMSRLINEKSNLSGQDMLAELDQHSTSLDYFDAWKYVDLMAETLNEQARHLMDTHKRTLQGIKLETRTTFVNWNKLSSVISCFHGFIWGLTSGLLDDTYKDCSTEISNMVKLACMSKFSHCIVIFEEFLFTCLNALFVDESQETEILFTVHNLPCCGIKHSSEKHSRIVKETGRSKHFASYYNNEGKNESGYDHPKTSSSWTQRSPAFANSISCVLNDFAKTGLSKMKNLNGHLLQDLLKGKSPQIAFALRELFMASAAIVNLKCMLSSYGDLEGDTDWIRLGSSSIGILLGTSHLILMEMVEMAGRPDPFCFVWLDGIVKFLEVLETNISSTDPELSKDAYTLLIDMHLRVMGKCISLQGKDAYMSSPEIGSDAKMFQSQNGSSGGDMLFLEKSYSINTFKARLRMSLRKLIRQPRKFYLKIVIQVLERALVGVQQNRSMVHEIYTGNAEGGNISLVAAGGIDCVLESVSGQKHVLEDKIPTLIDAIFNIIVHLQNRTIFYLEKLPLGECDVKPDAGSIILMCIEVLTKVSENHSFDMRPCHIDQCLHIPGLLFQDFHRLGVYCTTSSSSILFDNQKASTMKNTHYYNVDRQFSINLYASCCRLLCTILKHHKRKVEGSIAVLQGSIRTLLSCLETVNSELVSKKEYFAWEVQDAIKCARFLRRIYEEIRQQKDVLQRFSHYFLSTYISIYSGCGSLKTGINREIDEALRPGIYALIDICILDDLDLQQLHTILSEGPCRSTLATLRDDYRLNFQYEGKI